METYTLIPQAFLFFRFVDIIVITVNDRFWNVDQANCILKYFENMMIENCENRNDPDLVQAFEKKWWVESDFKVPNLPLSIRLHAVSWRDICSVMQ
jgi:hypothetical protein